MNKDHDFNKPIEDTSNEIAKKVLELLNEKKNILLVDQSKMTPEEALQHQGLEMDFGIDVMKNIAKTDIPADYSAHGIDKIIHILNALKNYINGSNAQIKDRILAMVLGVKSPKTDTLASDCATIRDLALKLQEVKDQTGFTDDDYFVKPKE